MDKNDTVFQEFLGYWRLSEEMIAKASKEDLAETARILAMQAAHMTRIFGEQPMPDYVNLLSAAIWTKRVLRCCVMAPRRLSGCWLRCRVERWMNSIRLCIRRRGGSRAEAALYEHS